MAVAEQTPALAVAAPATTVELRHPRMLIDGAWVDSMSGKLLSVENPAKRCPIAEVPRGDTADVNGAVEVAARAFPAWSKVAPRDRVLLRVAEALETRTEELARTIALETGNALRTQARPEARLTADIFRYFGGLAGELKGETIPLGGHILSYTRREPIGVVGAIIPWNAPVLLGALKVAPALCAGNTIVLKAAEDAPLITKALTDAGGKFLVRGGKTISYEGAAPAPDVVVVQFESLDKLQALYNSASYKEAIAVGDKYATQRIFGVEGASP